MSLFLWDDCEPLSCGSHACVAVGRHGVDVNHEGPVGTTALSTAVGNKTDAHTRDLVRLLVRTCRRNRPWVRWSHSNIDAGHMSMDRLT